jgi:hypothetical protein
VLASVTTRENEEVAAAVGIPEIVQLVPDPLIDNHEGNAEPVATVQA